MPKARYAERNERRGRTKPKKHSGKIQGARLEKMQGKRQKAGTHGTASEYVGRTKAIKRLQLSLRDFRRLCILKGIYPRDPKNKKHLDSKQTYYHYKDISYLAHEPLLKKFNEQLVRGPAARSRSSQRLWALCLSLSYTPPTPTHPSLPALHPRPMPAS